MCIVIDTNTLAHVFDSQAAEHDKFKPVLDWINTGKGKIVYGGTKYITELSKTKYLALFTEYNRQRKAIKVKDDVDGETLIVSNIVKDADFDDQHLVALLRVSGCKLICSLDERAYKYFHHDLLFSPAAKRPKIYNQLRHKNLLTDENIADICKPHIVLNKEQKIFMGI